MIRISLGGGALLDSEDLGQVLHKQLEYNEQLFSLPSRYPDSRSRFADLIERAHRQSGQLVVLVDEYDKPILDNIGNSAPYSDTDFHRAVGVCAPSWAH